MAFSGDAFSPKQFTMGFQAETAVGTAVVSAMLGLDIDSISSPSLNPVQVLDVRSGAGRTLKEADFFQTDKGTVREISFSGTADSTSLPKLLTNITGDTASAYSVLGTYNPPDISHGGTFADYTGTVTVAIWSPESTNAKGLIFSGCVLTSLKISGDMTAEGGRVKVEGTFKTGYRPDLSPASAPTISSFGSTNYYMTTWDTTKTVHGVANSVLGNFSLSLENDAVFSGFQGSNGEPEVIGRGSEFSAVLEAGLKYDSNTALLLETWQNQTTSSALTELSNNATFGSATTFGIQIPTGFLVDASLNEGDVMGLNVSVKGTGNVVNVVA